VRDARILAFAIVCGCAFLPGKVVALDRQEQAIYLIWHDTYGRSDMPPHIRWVMPDAQTCTDDTSGRGGFETPVGCREGLTLSPLEVSVAWHDGDTFDVTALAHELAHAAEARSGIIDPSHKTAPFQPGGAVEVANARLVEAGL
jgi:hypothetical protein